MRTRPPGPVVQGILSPHDRASEVLFGLIMALTLTGALEVGRATERDTRALFVTTLACNVAWGLVDGVMYVLNQVLGRGREALEAALDAGPRAADLRAADVLGGLGVFLLVVASTFPVALPFLVLADAGLAMKVSRGLSLVLLFLTGYAVGRYSGLRPVSVGLSMLGLGAVLVAIVKALGG